MIHASSPAGNDVALSLYLLILFNALRGYYVRLVGVLRKNDVRLVGGMPIYTCWH